METVLRVPGESSAVNWRNVYNPVFFIWQGGATFQFE